MADLQVTCVKKMWATHETITHLGGRTGGGGWCWTMEEVVDSINKKTDTFFTLEGGRRADIRVVNATPRPYVQTYADGQLDEQLARVAAMPLSAQAHHVRQRGFCDG
jgi:hypothetical protein